MNLCFLRGEIVEEIEFQFFYRAKKISMAKTKLLLENGSNIILKGYDKMADWMYRYLRKEDVIFVEGQLNSKGEIEVEWMKRWHIQE